MPAKTSHDKQPSAKTASAKASSDKTPSGKDPAGKDPSNKATSAKKPASKKPASKKPAAKKPAAKNAIAKKPAAKNAAPKKPKHTAFTVAVSAADDGTSAPALRVYVAMATDPLAAVATVQAMMPEAAVELSGTLSDRLAARLKLKAGEVRPI